MPALRRINFGDVCLRRAADHEVSRMTCLLNSTVFRTLRHERTRVTLRWLPPACLAIATFTAVTAAGSPAGAASTRKERTPAVSAASRPGGAPIMAIVSLRSQGITVYDTTGWIMRAPVSSGQTGRETPAGVFSVLEKDVDHHSNLYDDAWMPHMHRLTWSGIALHGGPLPGYAASHGCVRLPYGFASQLFGVTKVGMRVIISPGDAAPVDIAHPALPQSKPVSADAVAARAAEAADAASKADRAKRAAEIASWAAAQAAAPVNAAETLKHKAELQLATADREDGKAKAAEAKAAAAAEDAKTKAAEAKLTAEGANAKAAEAKQTAEDAKAKAAEAKQAAQGANAKAAEAKQAAQGANAKAAEAKQAAQGANAKAAEAKQAAQGASAKAAEAKQAVEGANAKAAEAKLKAEEVKAAEATLTAEEVTAAEARLTAEELNTKAAEAKLTAEELNARAAEAKLTAEEASATAAEAKLKAEEANAKVAETKLKTEEANAKTAEAKLKAEEGSAKAAEAKLKAEEASAKAAEAKMRDGEATVSAADDAKAKAVAARHKADDATTRAAEAVADEGAKLTGAKADQQAKVDAAEAARKASAEAEARRTEAAEAASAAVRQLEPASVFISRKTQRLYVRQAFQPVLEVPVTIQDPDRPIGTHVFTATGSMDGTADLRWTVVSLKGEHGDARVAAARDAARGVPDVEPAPVDASGAKAALDRIAIPPDVADRIGGMISPRSSLIVSDEALSPETGKGTEFVVVMNDEPQGGIKHRNLPSNARHER
jgi:hypothetical protein